MQWLISYTLSQVVSFEGARPHRGTSPLGVMRSQTVKLRCPAAAAAEISSDATGLLDSHKRLVETRRRLQLVVDLLTGSLA